MKKHMDKAYHQKKYQFAWNYFKTELADDTPFTHSGADKVKVYIMPMYRANKLNWEAIR